MPSPVNTPVQVDNTTSNTITDTAEHVIATSGPVNTDALETQVLVDCNVDMTNSSSGTTLTLRIRRGTTTGGTLVGAAWGPFTLTASARSSQAAQENDVPGAVAGQQYVLTAQVAGNGGTVTFNHATISIQAQSAS